VWRNLVGADVSLSCRILQNESAKSQRHGRKIASQEGIVRLRCAYAAAWALGSTRSPPVRIDHNATAALGRHTPSPPVPRIFWPGTIPLLSKAVRTTQRSYTQARARVGPDPALPYAWHRTSACLHLAPMRQVAGMGCVWSSNDGRMPAPCAHPDPCGLYPSRLRVGYRPFRVVVLGTAIMTCHRVSHSGVIYSVLAIDGYRASAPALRTLSSLRQQQYVPHWVHMSRSRQ
jgi:hypothetical protein